MVQFMIICNILNAGFPQCINSFSYGACYNTQYQNVSIPIAPNCTLDTGTFLGLAYDHRFGIIIFNMSTTLGNLSFSMMIWLFGVSLFHLSFAARNELRLKEFFTTSCWD